MPKHLSQWAGFLSAGTAMLAMLALATTPHCLAAQDRRLTTATDTIDGETVARRASAVDPLPPRTLYLGVVETTAGTLPRGQGYIAAGYRVENILARTASVAPFVVHAAYGVADRVTVSVGSGFLNYGHGGASPYIAHKFRLVDGEHSTVALGHYVGISTGTRGGRDGTVVFGTSLAVSNRLSDRATLSVGLGAAGSTEEYDPGRFTGPGSVGPPGVGALRRTSTDAVLTISGEYAARPELKVVGEYLLVDPADEKGLLIVGLRFLGRGLAAELSLAGWLEHRDQLWPVVNVGYRF